LNFFRRNAQAAAGVLRYALTEFFLIRDKKAFVTDRDKCMECGACANNCEFGAIRVNSGVGCAAAIINGMITGGPPSCDCGVESGSNCCG
jgi:NAD-dependent dihydropyrimidine dehydrogenase PreA subunit